MPELPSVCKAAGIIEEIIGKIKICMFAKPQNVRCFVFDHAMLMLLFHTLQISIKSFDFNILCFSYVQWAESGGARVVPIIIGKDAAYYQQVTM